MYRVDSRFANCISYESVRKTLWTMAEGQRDDLREAIKPGSGRHYAIVGDNVQTFFKERDHRIGRESKMLKGFAGMAVEMQDFPEGAFNVDEYVQRQALGERCQLTAEVIRDDIDWDHLKRVSKFEFLRALIDFTPALRNLCELLKTRSKSLEKNPIPPTRRTKLFPLGTNSGDEMSMQGMKQITTDFLDTQLNIKPKTQEEEAALKLIIFSGDGKTFDQLINLKKYLVSEEGSYESLRCMVPMLELWHTKWTKLSAICRTHMGKDFPHDPSTLACLAGVAECPMPPDLKKVDFYTGAHLVDLALDAHMLNCWE